MSDNLWFFTSNQRPDVVVTGSFAPMSRRAAVRGWLAEWAGLAAPLAFIAACYAVGYWAAGWPAIIGYTLGGIICLPIAIWLRR